MITVLSCSPSNWLNPSITGKVVLCAPQGLFVKAVFDLFFFAFSFLPSLNISPVLCSNSISATRAQAMDASWKLVSIPSRFVNAGTSELNGIRGTEYFHLLGDCLNQKDSHELAVLSTYICSLREKGIEIHDDYRPLETWERHAEVFTITIEENRTLDRWLERAARVVRSEVPSGVKHCVMSQCNTVKGRFWLILLAYDIKVRSFPQLHTFD